MRGATQVFIIIEVIFLISIHAPHAGCDDKIDTRLLQIFRFQSTHPMRGATFLNIEFIWAFIISIHAPHAGCDINYFICDLLL